MQPEELLRHLERQDELLMDAYRSLSHELHKLQVEEEMLMRKFYQFWSTTKNAGSKDFAVNKDDANAKRVCNAAADD